MERVSLAVMATCLTLMGAQAEAHHVCASSAVVRPSSSRGDKPAREARDAAKTRPGSVLESDKLLPSAIDLRSDAERTRDAELRLHFSRLAELDVIAAVVVAGGKVKLAEQVEQVRRKEVQRHQRVMMAWWKVTAEASALARGGQ